MVFIYSFTSTRYVTYLPIVPSFLGTIHRSFATGRIDDCESRSVMDIAEVCNTRDNVSDQRITAGNGLLAAKMT